MSTKQSRGWTPIRNGALYCSPRCGFGCTFAAFEKATLDAAKLARTLGRGWAADVWENAGWHYAASHRASGTTVHPYDSGQRFTVFCNGTPEDHPTPQVVIEDSCGDPRNAVMRAVLELRRVSAALERRASALERSR